ncbi:hypothetical protein Moror_5268 [Moniliophthora roreri MCA 2997]|uniref:Uncharacterized protein n=2 Tax=Moniliophthora roreri TaxID=221103 RepID=V2X8Q2_MONRO|nr:hypothetical protein Moror_5268 [Moniliophthora roreri MCA 2997]
MHSRAKSVPSLKRKRFRTPQAKQRDDESEDAKWYQQELGTLLTLYSANQHTRARSLTHSHNRASRASIDMTGLTSPSFQLDPGYYRKSTLTHNKPPPTFHERRERPPSLALGRPPPRSAVPSDLSDDEIDSLVELYLDSPTTPSTSTSSSFSLSPVTDDFGDARDLDDFLFDIPELETEDDLYEDVDFEPPMMLSLRSPGSSSFDEEFSLEESLTADGVNDEATADGGAAQKHGVWSTSNKKRKRAWLKKRRSTTRILEKDGTVTSVHSLAALGLNSRS